MPLFTSIDGTKREISSLYTGVDGTRMSIDHIPVGIDGTMYQVKLGNMCTVTIVFQNDMTVGADGETSIPANSNEAKGLSIAIVNEKQFSIPNFQPTTGESSVVEDVENGDLFQIDVRLGTDAPATPVILNGDTVFSGGVKAGNESTVYDDICVFRADGDLTITLWTDGNFWTDGGLYTGANSVTLTGAATLISIPETE